MAGKADSKLKTLKLLEILREQTDEDHPLSAHEICDILDRQYGIAAERKSIYTNIKVLESNGNDIIQTTLPKKGYFLGEREYQDEETMLMSDAIQSATFISEKKSAELISKIQSGFSKYQRAEFNETVYIDTSRKTENEKIYIHINKIKEAIDEDQMIEISYKKREIIAGKATDATRIFSASPYAMMWFDDHYYLICNNKKYNNLMHLRIERITKVEIKNEARRPIRDIIPEYALTFNTVDYASKIFDGFPGEMMTVMLHCQPYLYEILYDKFGKDLKVIKIYEDNSFDAKIRVAVSEGFVNWVLKFGDTIKVTSPDAVAEMVLAKAEKIAECYAE